MSLSLGLGFIPAAQADEAWLARSRPILEGTKTESIPDWLRATLEPKGLRSLAREVIERSPLPFAGTPASNPTQTYVLYVSMSMGRDHLKEIIEDAAGHRDHLIVFRGLRPGERLKNFVRTVRELTQGIDRDHWPAIVIDPNRFQNAGVTTVPTLTLESRDHILARVHGVSHIEWLQSRLGEPVTPTSTGTRDFGRVGDTLAIAEADPVAQLKANMGKIDWQAYQRRARQDFWAKTAFVNLPEATETHEDWIDPAVMASQDVKSPSGAILIPAGRKMNPLDILPFRQRLLVFDATRPDQVTTVQRLAKETVGRRVVLIATQVDRAGGWESFERLEQQLQATIFLLTPELKARFRLTRVPALIEAEKSRLRVRTLKPEAAS